MEIIIKTNKIKVFIRNKMIKNKKITYKSKIKITVKI
jgi:hypothetical protein